MPALACTCMHNENAKHDSGIMLALFVRLRGACRLLSFFGWRYNTYQLVLILTTVIIIATVYLDSNAFNVL